MGCPRSGRTLRRFDECTDSNGNTECGGMYPAPEDGANIDAPFIVPGIFMTQAMPAALQALWSVA